MHRSERNFRVEIYAQFPKSILTRLVSRFYEGDCVTFPFLSSLFYRYDENRVLQAAAFAAKWENTAFIENSYLKEVRGEL